MAILIRPVREQFEHDRVIRALELAFGERFAVDVNVGDDRKVPVKTGTGQAYPDLILSPTDAGKRPVVIVEVETGESVNNLEAMYQWVLFAKARAEFRLYVPVAFVDVARRLCVQHSVALAEIWSYASVGGDQIRLERVFRSPSLPSDPGQPATEPLVDIVSIRTRRASDIEAAVESAIQNPRREEPHPIDSRRAIAEAAAAAAAEPLRLPPLKARRREPAREVVRGQTGGLRRHPDGGSSGRQGGRRAGCGRQGRGAGRYAEGRHTQRRSASSSRSRRRSRSRLPPRGRRKPCPRSRSRASPSRLGQARSEQRRRQGPRARGQPCPSQRRWQRPSRWPRLRRPSSQRSLRRGAGSGRPGPHRRRPSPCRPDLRRPSRYRPSRYGPNRPCP